MRSGWDFTLGPMQIQHTAACSSIMVSSDYGGMFSAQGAVAGLQWHSQLFARSTFAALCAHQWLRTSSIWGVCKALLRANYLKEKEKFIRKSFNAEKGKGIQLENHFREVNKYLYIRSQQFIWLAKQTRTEKIWKSIMTSQFRDCVNFRYIKVTFFSVCV